MRPSIKAIPTYSLLIVLGSVFSLPVLWMLSSSLHELKDIFVHPYRWIPSVLRFENYERAVTLMTFLRYLINTLIITIPTIVFTVLSSSLIAYGFSRIEFKGREKLFALCLATMMLPGQVTMIPLYMGYASLGWVDTYLPLIIPALFGSPFYIFLLRQFLFTIPKEYDEAALMEGTSRLRIYWSIILPQAKPALLTVVIFAFIGSWNDFYGPLVYINSPELATLTLGLNMMKTQILGSGTIEWNVMMAASMLILLPNVIIFFLAQKHFVTGINIGSLRG